MFKKIVLAILVALPLSTFAQKFGVVDLEAVFTDTSKKYEEEFQKLQEEVNKLYADYQAIQNDASTPESIKERRMQEIQEKAQKVDQFRNTAAQDERSYQSCRHRRILYFHLPQRTVAAPLHRH